MEVDESVLLGVLWHHIRWALSTPSSMPISVENNRPTPMLLMYLEREERPSWLGLSLSWSCIHLSHSLCPAVSLWNHHNPASSSSWHSSQGQAPSKVSLLPQPFVVVLGTCAPNFVSRIPGYKENRKAPYKKAFKSIHQQDTQEVSGPRLVCGWQDWFPKS